MKSTLAAALALLVVCAGAVAAQDRASQGDAQPRAQSSAQPRAQGNALEMLRSAREAGLLVAVDVQDLPTARNAGQRAVNGGTRAGAGAACFNCHGMQGQGDAGGGFPRLAGLPAFYIAKQLANYADGSRPNEVMTPIAVQLTEAERRNIGVYYASLSAPATPVRDRDSQLVQQGASIASLGSPVRGVQSCSNCHGPNGIGMPPDVPYLAGQNAQYMEAQLQRWQQGQRKNDILGVMRDVSHRLSAEEQRAVSQYFASLPPPARVQTARVPRPEAGESTSVEAPPGR